MPEVFIGDEEKQPYVIPHIEMSPELYQKIDWQAKLDRSAENIDMLIEDGGKRALEFLEKRKRVVESKPLGAPPARQGTQPTPPAAKQHAVSSAKSAGRGG